MKVQGLFAEGMREENAFRVERLALDEHAAAAIEIVAQQGVSEIGEMYADLPTLPRNQKTRIKKSKEFQRFSLLFYRLYGIIF